MHPQLLSFIKANIMELEGWHQEAQLQEGHRSRLIFLSLLYFEVILDTQQGTKQHPNRQLTEWVEEIFGFD